MKFLRQKFCSYFNKIMRRYYVFLFSIVNTMCIVALIGASAGNAADRPVWEPYNHRLFYGPYFKPFSDENRAQKANQWWQKHYGPGIYNEIESGKNKLWKRFEVAAQSCKGSADCVHREFNNWQLELARFLDEVVFKYIDKGPWKPRMKKIYRNIFKIESNLLGQPCGWYISPRLQRRHFDEPDLIPDYGGARCEEVRIKINQGGQCK